MCRLFRLFSSCKSLININSTEEGFPPICLLIQQLHLFYWSGKGKMVDMPRRFAMVAVSTGCELSWGGKAEGGLGVPWPRPDTLAPVGTFHSLFPRTALLNSLRSNQRRDRGPACSRSRICHSYLVLNMVSGNRKDGMVCFLSPAPRRAGEPLESHTGEGPRRPPPALKPCPSGRIHAWGLRVTRQEGARSRTLGPHRGGTNATSALQGRGGRGGRRRRGKAA